MVIWKTRNINLEAEERNGGSPKQTSDVRCWRNLACEFWALRPPEILVTLVTMKYVTRSLSYKWMSEQSQEVSPKLNNTLLFYWNIADLYAVIISAIQQSDPVIHTFFLILFSTMVSHIHCFTKATKDGIVFLLGQWWIQNNGVNRTDLWLPRRWGSGGKELEFGISRGKLVYIGQIKNNVLLYSMGKYIQYP